MAHKESGLLDRRSSYTLGEYSFHINATETQEGGETQVQAVCTEGSKSAYKSIYFTGKPSDIQGWYVEANETEASVYAVLDIAKGSDSQRTNPGIDGVPETVNFITGTAGGSSVQDARTGTMIGTDSSGNSLYIAGNGKWAACNVGSSTIVTAIEGNIFFMFGYNSRGEHTVTRVTFFDYSVTYFEKEAKGNIGIQDILGLPDNNATNRDGVMWVMKYGNPSGEKYKEERLIARFAIDLAEAGGYPGGGGDWDEESDYDSEHYPDPEERDPDDPTYTLYLNVTGALSGRHNDPLHDTSYSYSPSDKATKKAYGSGGDGGHGGGGGGGASTVVVKKFATNRADSKDMTVAAKRHGYGSGGGKGGKGGDGIILIYY